MAEEEPGRLIYVIRRRRRRITKEEYIATEIPYKKLSGEGCRDLLRACVINNITGIDRVVYSSAL